MLNDAPHAQSRAIARLEVPTPLLVPSFSSLGFPEVKSIYEVLKHRLYGVCLISAWDLARGSLPDEALTDTDVVFLDSGGYEETGHLALCEQNDRSSLETVWSESAYRGTISSIPDHSNAVVVSFDRATELEHQIEGALQDLGQAQNLALDFLIKPEATGQMVNIPRLSKFTTALENFSAVGVTARETSDSLLGRCRSITMLRNILSEAELNVPIHVFGAITPAEVLAYFFSGADIFDGLNWLRLSFASNSLTLIENLAFEESNWSLDDDDILLGEWSRNLAYMYQLQESMRRFAGSGDLESLVEIFPIAETAARVAHIAGANLAVEV